MAEELSESSKYFDVLVVGAGPTGLTLAAQLARFGVRLRIVDNLMRRRSPKRTFRLLIHAEI